jgi:Rrf2 family protein
MNHFAPDGHVGLTSVPRKKSPTDCGWSELSRPSADRVRCVRGPRRRERTPIAFLGGTVFSTTARYALRILGELVRSPESWVTSDQLARGSGIPANYLSKILAQLRKRGIVEAQKGWGGGFRVLPAALDRPIGDVIPIFDGRPAEPRPCIFGQAQCDSEHPCPLHDHWERIREIQDEMTSQIRVRDLSGR